MRIVLKDNSLADLKKLENVDLVKGAFVAGDQIQLIFGPGLVNDVYEVFSKYVGIADMTLKSLSDVFVAIIPAILAAALLMGITGVLSNYPIVKENETLYAINRLASLAST